MSLGGGDDGLIERGAAHRSEGTSKDISPSGPVVGQAEDVVDRLDVAARGATPVEQGKHGDWGHGQEVDAGPYGVYRRPAAT